MCTDEKYFLKKCTGHTGLVHRFIDEEAEKQRRAFWHYRAFGIFVCVSGVLVVLVIVIMSLAGVDLKGVSFEEEEDSVGGEKE